jgi:hypothetical protein
MTLGILLRVAAAVAEAQAEAIGFGGTPRSADS